ncbi:LytR/AlgR family response regulator transcription factor, partial [Salinivirga cyanobacteriivorans]
MKKIHCTAIDDEPLALTILKDYVSKVPYLEMVETFTSASAASSFIQNEKPDILFLDIQMPDIKGIDFINTLVYKPIIILTTAYSEYAVQGYNLDVTDYLLKPIPYDRFLQSINKAMQLISNRSSNDINLEKDYLFVKSGHKSVKVNFENILFVEGLKEYVSLYTENKKFLKLDTFKNLENLLPKNFVRVHKSYIVNIDHISSFYGNTLEIND